MSKQLLDTLNYYAKGTNYDGGYTGYGEDNDTRSSIQKDRGAKAKDAIAEYHRLNGLGPELITYSRMARMMGMLSFARLSRVLPALFTTGVKIVEDNEE